MALAIGDTETATKIAKQLDLKITTTTSGSTASTQT
jgi:hypothetical protein